MAQEGGLGLNFLGSLIRKLIPALAKNVVSLLAVQTAASPIDAGVQKAIHGSGTSMNKKFKLCVNSDELKDILQVIAALEHSRALIEGIMETVANKIQKQESGFLLPLLGSMALDFFLNRKTGRGGIKTGEGGVRAREMVGEGAIYGDLYGKNRMGVRPRILYEKRKKLLPLHALTNFEIIEYYSGDDRFNGVYSRDELPGRIKNGAYVINLDDLGAPGTHWVVVYCNGNGVTYFESFAVGHILKEFKFFVKSKKITSNIYRLQHYYSIMCGYYCIAFIDHMFGGDNLQSFNKFLSPTDFDLKDKFI